jgi:predicted RNA-binding Zn-ribbon protein involved in translation (DUF1610 family)
VPARRHIRLRSIPRPIDGTRTVFTAGDDAPKRFTFIRGDSPGLSFDCAKCGTPLMIDVERGQVTNIVLRCNNCGTYNEADVPPQPRERR